MTVTLPPAAVRVLIAAAVLAPIAWLLAQHFDRMALQHRLEPIASRIAGRPVHVHCPSVPGRLMYDTDLGHVMVDGNGRVSDTAQLAQHTCAELDAISEGAAAGAFACLQRSGDSCGDDAGRVAEAIDTLTHESVHLSGVLDEDLTECRSLQTMAWTATRFGATPQAGEALAKLQYATGYRQLPVRYQAPDCVEGGRLDLRPDDPVFP